MRRVGHFRVELDTVQIPTWMPNRRKGARRRGGHGLKAIGQLNNLIAMAHPHAGVRRNAMKHPPPAFHRQLGAAVFTFVGRDHTPPQQTAHQLKPVADPKHRYAHVQNSGVAGRRVLAVHTGWPSGQNDALGPKGLKHLHRGIRRQQDAERSGLTHSAGDQLDELRSKIQNRNDFNTSRDTGDVCGIRHGYSRETIVLRRPHRIPSNA